MIVHMDGTVESAGGADHAEEVPAPAQTSEPIPESEAAFGEDPNPFDSFDEPAQNNDQELLEPAAQEEPAFQPEAAAEPLAEAVPEPEPEPEPEVYRVPVAPSAADPLAEIARFGNSDGAGRDGSLRYNLRIAGIDTADMREAFREALTDRKFMWDTDQIVRSIRDGEVSIENVTASKAHVLVSRLRSMPLQIRWEQYVVQQG